MEWPAWRLIIEKGLSRAELETWDLYDLEKANAYLDIQSDYEAAYSGYSTPVEERQ